MAFDFSTLVTDRTQADVATGNAKGTYNAADLNRVDECLEDLVARLGRMGYNVPGYERVKIPRETKPTRKKYRYLRMTISALRGSTEIVQLSEIKILSKTGSVMPWPQGTTVTASIEETKAEESPGKLIDRNVETKFRKYRFFAGGVHGGAVYPEHRDAVYR